MLITLESIDDVASRIASILREGDAIGLSGSLGAGKTTLVRALLRTLGLEGEAPSPSFAIVQPYAPPEVNLPVLHVDLYRISNQDDMTELGLDEARDDHILFIEWPERMGSYLWEDMLMIDLQEKADGSRLLTATVPPAWKERWPFLT